MICKKFFSEIIIDQEFYALEEHVGDRNLVFKKLEASQIGYSPPGRTKCRFCGTPLDKWVNATQLSEYDRQHFCPNDEVFIVHKSSDTMCA